MSRDSPRSQRWPSVVAAAGVGCGASLKEADLLKTCVGGAMVATFGKPWMEPAGRHEGR